MSYFHFWITCSRGQKNVDKFLCIHEDGEAYEEVGGDIGGQVTQVGRDEQRGRDRHQARGHQLNWGVFSSLEAFFEEKGGNHRFLFLPAALKASFAKTREANQSRTGTKKAEMFGSVFFLSFVTYLAPIGNRGEQ